MNSMTKDKLYLIKPDVSIKPHHTHADLTFLKDCATIEGLLSFYPSLRESIDVEYVPPNTSYKSVIEGLYGDHKNKPLLILQSDEGLRAIHLNASLDGIGDVLEDKFIIDDVDGIIKYVSTVHLRFVNPYHTQETLVR